MRQYQLHKQGEAYVPVITEQPKPVPGPGQVLVRVRACSLNYRDLIVARGRFGDKTQGRVPLSDGAGEVEAVGGGVTRFKPGDRVAACFFQDWIDGPFEMRYHGSALGGEAPGMLAEYVALPEQGWIKFPEHLSFQEAACLPCAAVTAWQALVVRGALAAGETVLALGTGGVSIFALQFAVALGARVIVTSSSDAKLERARGLGAWEGVNYQRTPDWDKEVWRLTDKRGVDHVVEVGGPGTLEKSLASLAAGGHVALIGVLTGFGAPTGSLFPLVTKNARMNGIYVGSRAHFEAMNQFIAERRLRPVIDRVFPFEQAAEAYRYQQSGGHFGKIVVEIP
ncbi:zinc-dependent alcohol dehydrogenase family protein [Pelomicrobium sp.]|jgi:NADPH:quinone reductase-like Zn-dependent oxidoreductase|uniref:zinc-dependent alcohol dehydrogenase family protein n=1 Tax=Pelomicrobium sp. TaxID=2815319 RepID=UPI002FDE5ED8